MNIPAIILSVLLLAFTVVIYLAVKELIATQIELDNTLSKLKDAEKETIYYKQLFSKTLVHKRSLENIVNKYLTK